MKALKNALRKTPFFHKLIKDSDVMDKPSIKLESVKGNINSKGQKIAHIPGGRYYDIVKPEETFNSLKEAEEAGYRLSKQ